MILCSRWINCSKLPKDPVNSLCLRHHGHHWNNKQHRHNKHHWHNKRRQHNHCHDHHRWFDHLFVSFRRLPIDGVLQRGRLHMLPGENRHNINTRDWLDIQQVAGSFLFSPHACSYNLITSFCAMARSIKI